MTEAQAYKQIETTLWALPNYETFMNFIHNAYDGIDMDTMGILTGYKYEQIDATTARLQYSCRIYYNDTSTYMLVNISNHTFLFPILDRDVTNTFARVKYNEYIYDFPEEHIVGDYCVVSCTFEAFGTKNIFVVDKYTRKVLYSLSDGVRKLYEGIIDYFPSILLYAKFESYYSTCTISFKDLKKTKLFDIVAADELLNSLQESSGR